MSTNGFPLAELTTTLMREVFKAISDSAMEQSEAYAALAAQVAVPLAVYQDRLLGETRSAKQETARRYVDEVLVPLLAPVAGELKDPVELTDAGRKLLIEHFQGVSALISLHGEEAVERTVEEAIVEAKDGDSGVPWQLRLESLEAFALARLMRDARDSYTRLTALLQAGMQNISVTGGQLLTRVIMQATTGEASGTARSAALALPGRTTPALGLNVQLVNEKSATAPRLSELMGSVRIDFRVGTFPPVKPSGS